MNGAHRSNHSHCGFNQRLNQTESRSPQPASSEGPGFAFHADKQRLSKRNVLGRTHQPAIRHWIEEGTMTAALTAQDERDRGSQPPPTSRVGSGIRRITPAPISRPIEPVVAGLSFLEGVGTKRLGRDTLDTWIDQNLVTPGYTSRPLRIYEPIFGALPTDKGCSPFLPESPPTDEMFALMVRARARVIGHLKGLLRTPPEDRFLNAAIFAGRVRRSSIGKIMTWIPRPKITDALSDIITSLFVSDILGRREFYVQNLCICRKCGRVRFDAAVAIERDLCFFC
jgi:hypothetical protein